MSNYPERSSNNNDTPLEVSDEELDHLCREANDGRIVEVYGTIGFCMFIARRCLAEIGLFDSVNFLRGYGEETDFCYRARRLGWKHIVVGNVFVRHWEDASFGEEKQRLVAQSFKTFETLHPGHQRDRDDFAKLDPLRDLRRNLDIARARRLMAGTSVLPIVTAASACRLARTAFALIFDPDIGTAAILVPHGLVLPNLGTYALPKQIAALNRTLEQLGIKELRCGSASLRARFLSATGGLPFEERLKAKLSPPAEPVPPRASNFRHEQVALGVPDDDLRIDVIVPIYNQRQLVEPCLASLLGAANKTQFELVVVDDASTDAELKEVLKALAETGRITLLSNETNLGFTQSVNRGMRLHPCRDVVLLNSDTLVFADWIDRLRRAAQSDPRIATVNPMTNGSHISSYPFRRPDGHVSLEISDADLDSLAAQTNRGRRVEVHYTVGFCIYIRRAALADVGLFDAERFPVGYCEEADFCYRARRVGWRHVVTGDVFVRHWEGQSFGKRKAHLMAKMFEVFSSLHPDIAADDINFEARDPVRPLRQALDLARLKRILAGADTLPCVDAALATASYRPAMIFDGRNVRISTPAIPTLASLPTFGLPASIAAFNTALASLGIKRLVFEDRAVLERFSGRIRGLPMELGPTAVLEIARTATWIGSGRFHAGEVSGGRNL